MELNLRKCESLTIEDEELNNKERLIVTKRKKNDEFEEHEKVVLEIDEEEQVEIVIVIKRRKEQIDKERKVVVKITNGFDEEEEQTDKERSVIVRKRKEIDDNEEQDNERSFRNKRREIDEEEEQLDEKRVVDDEYPPPPTCAYLPADLILESILTRLPARALAICSCVCKLWHSTIYRDTRFSSSHFVQNQNKLSLGFSFINTKIDDAVKAYFYSFDDEDNQDDDDDIYITLDTALTLEDINELVGNCNGLICIKLLSEPNEEKGIVSVVCRTRCEILSFSYLTPTLTGELCKYLCHGFGFDSVSQVFKVVLVFTSPTDEEFICLVFTLGTNSWRTITTTTAEISLPPDSFASPDSPLVTRIRRMPCRQATLCGNDLLWKTTNKVGDGSVIEMLLSFDLHNEKIRFIQLPTECTLPVMMNWHEYLEIDHLLEFKGYPCIARSEKIEISNSDHSGHRCNDQSSFCCCCCKVHLYILKDKVKQVWVKEETLDVQIKDPEGLLPGPFCCYFGTTTATTMPPPTRVLTFHDQVLLYWFDGECLMLYNLHEKYLKVVRCSHSYPRLFPTKLHKLPGRSEADDIDDMDYQLHTQVDNMVSLETFIPEGETCTFSCFEDLQQIARKKQLAGWVNPGRGSSKIYTSFSLSVS